MAAALVPASGTAAIDGKEFGQDVSQEDREQMMLPSDAYDPTINSQYMEVYLYWARIERERELNDTRAIPDTVWNRVFKKATGQSHKINWDDGPEDTKHTPAVDEKTDASANPDRTAGPVMPEEYERAYRALRVASWQGVFYLITTDILGFSSAPEAFNELGIGPGVLVYTFFYLLAVFAGQVIWKLYLDYDSSRYPVKCYADLGERTLGRSMRHLFNIFQSGQLLFNVALLIIGNGQTLVSIINYKFCYLALNVFFTIIGVLGGQIRSLRNFSWFANLNIWLNIIVMIITVAGIWTYPPVPSLSEHLNLDQPVIVSGWVPSYTIGWYQQVSGVQLAVFAYGGAMIFPEFMAEMRRPRDFWKSMLGAQLFCYIMYMLFGLIVYLKQGQYTSILPGLDFDNQQLILANNIIGLFTIMIAAVLYGNIGVKVFYENVLRAYFKAPSMFSNRGRLYWSVTVTLYWFIAWIIGEAVPNITALVTLVGATFILQFTYTFPPLLCLAYWMQRDAMKGDREWTPGVEPGTNRIDTWKDKSRWMRGIKSYWYAKAFLALVVLAAIANMALGMYAGIESAIEGYKGGYNIPFSCCAPEDPKALLGLCH